jgi:hypothetical protein
MITSNGQPLTFTGTTQISIDAELGGAAWWAGSAITVSGLTATASFVNVSMTGSALFVGCTFVGSAVGARYNATLNGVINTGGGGANFLPGNSSGTTSLGGQYT